MPTTYNDISVTGSIINATVIGEYLPSTGYFNTLQVNGTGVSLSGHLHTTSDLTNFSAGLSGISNLGDIPSGVYIYSTGLNVFSTGSLSSFARTMLDDASADAVRATLGIASLVTTSGLVVVGTGTTADIILSDTSGTPTIFNNNRKDIDFYVKGSGSNKEFYYDASIGRLGINTTAPDASLHIVSTCALDGLKLESTTNCSTGVHILMIHYPGSTPIDGSFPATITLAGRDHNGNQINYGRIKSRAVLTDNNSATGTLGELYFYVDRNASDNQVARLGNSLIAIGTTNVISTGSTEYNLIGSGNTINGSSLVLFGNNNSANVATKAVILGTDNDSFGAFNHIIGRENIGGGSGNSIVGYSVYQSGNLSNIYANNVSFTGNYATIIGNDNQGSGAVVLLIGKDLWAIGPNNLLIGSGNLATSSGSILVGYNSIYAGNTGVVIGTNNATTGDSNFIIGNNISVVSTGLFVCGQSVVVNNVADALIMEKNVSVSNASGIVVVGRGNNISSTNNIVSLFGYQNALRNTIRESTIIGDNNAISNVSGSILFGSKLTSSGTIRNSINIGKQNYFGSVSHNNIWIGNLNNQDTLKLNSDGSVTGTPSANGSAFINSLFIGNQNIVPISGNMILGIGNKNSIGGNGTVVAGHINTLRFADYSTLFGKSNYLAGYDNLLVGNNNNLFGNSSVVLAPRGSDVFGAKNIVLGNNGFVSRSIVMGQDNALYGDNNKIVGNSNNVGYTRYAFSSTISSSQISTYTINGTTDLVPGDRIFVYVYNPLGSDAGDVYIYDRTIASNGVQYNAGTNTTVITPNNGSITVTNNYRSNVSNFDDAFDTSTTSVANGYIIKVSQGSNNYIYGDANVISSGTGNVILGYKNNVSGIGNMIFGNSIINTLSNTMVIGPSNTKKVLIGDNIVFNTGLGHSSIYLVGSDSSVFTNFDLVNKRLGINANTPRSDLDVSGTITTAGLRFGLTATPSSILGLSSDGTVSAFPRTTISGSTNGLLYRISDTLASGLNRWIYNTSTNGLTVYGNQPSSESTFVPGLTITPNVGMVINANSSYNDDEFNLVIYGSGDPNSRPLLMSTQYTGNRITFYNTVTDTGIFKGDIRVTGNLITPSLQTSGTILSINRSTKALEYNKMYANTLLTVGTGFEATGVKTTRWFPSEKLFCLSDFTTHTDVENTFLESDYNTVISNNPSYQTVFNRQGLGSHPGSGFVVLYSGVSVNGRGLRIDYNSKQVGINTTAAEIKDRIDSQLVVNGSTFTSTLRVGDASTSGYALVAVDNSGNVGYRAIDLGLATSNLSYPFIVETTAGVKKLKLSSKDENGTTLDSSGPTNKLGRMLAWNGDSDNWYSTPQIRAYKGDASDLRTNNLLFGPYASNYKQKTKDAHIFSAGSFHSSDSDYVGSSQYAQYYLRGSGASNAAMYLYTDWSIDNNAPGLNANNTIHVPENATQNHSVWHYEVIVSVIGKNSGGNISAGTLKLEGAFKAISGYNNWTVIGASTSKITDSALSAIGAELIGNGALVGVRCTGVAGINTLWSAVAKINQLTLPSF